MIDYACTSRVTFICTRRAQPLDVRTAHAREAGHCLRGCGWRAWSHLTIGNRVTVKTRARSGFPACAVATGDGGEGALLVRGRVEDKLMYASVISSNEARKAGGQAQLVSVPGVWCDHTTARVGGHETCMS